MPQRAATKFKLELAEMEKRHHLTFEIYEEGKLTLEEYLDLVVFYRSDHSPGLSFGNTCSPSRSHIRDD